MKYKLFSLGCLTAVLLFFTSSVWIGAQDTTWEGTASMSRFGEFPLTGFYAASNSFPRNTIVQVRNVRNGRETTVIISDRLSNSSLFMLLSREAAITLDIPQDEIARVKVSVKESAFSPGATSAVPLERAFTSDPDRNPAAGGVIPEYRPPVPVTVPEDASPLTVDPTETTPSTVTPSTVTPSTVTPETPYASDILSGPVIASGPILIPMILPKPPEEVKASEVVKTPEIVEIPEQPAAEDSVTASSIAGSPLIPSPIGIIPQTPEAADERPLAAEIGPSPAPEMFVLETVVMPAAPEEGLAEGASARELPKVSEITGSPVTSEGVAAYLLQTPDEPIETAAVLPERLDTPTVSSLASAVPEDVPVPMISLMEPEVAEPESLAAADAIEPVDAAEIVETVEPSDIAAVTPSETTEETVAAAILPDISEEDPTVDAPTAAELAGLTPAPEEAPVIAMAEVPQEVPPLAADLEGKTPEEIAGPPADGVAMTLPTPIEEAAAIVETVPEAVPEETGPVITEDTAPAAVGTDTDLGVETAEPGLPADFTPLAADDVPAIPVEEEKTPDLALAGPDVPKEEPAVAVVATVDDTTVTVTEESFPSPTETAIVLTPAEPRPPTPIAAEVVPEGTPPVAALAAETPAAATPSVTEPAATVPAATVPVITTPAEKTDVRIALAERLEKGSYYVQLGVYSEAESAKRLADTYAASFPVSIYKAKEDKFYKVLLGPVNEDETGGLLFTFKARGFKDAFIRQEK